MAYVTYTIKMAFGETLEVEVDFAQAAATIYTLGEDEDGEPARYPTPYQTADCRHRADDLKRLMIEHAGPDFYRAPDDDREDWDQILDEAIAGATIS